MPSPSDTDPDAALAPKKILLLYSSGEINKAKQLFQNGFSTVLKNAGFTSNDVFIEYLDPERQRNEQNYLPRLADRLKADYAKRQIGLMIAVQQPALNFFMHEGRSIMPDRPLITVQAELPGTGDAHGRRIIGHFGKSDIRGTLERALELFPQSERVLLVFGYSEADRRLAEQAAQSVAPWRTRLAIDFSGALTLDQLLEKAAHLPAHSIIIYGAYSEDSASHAIVSSDVEGMLTKVANAPVFGLSDRILESEGIGGSLVSIRATGARVGETTLDLLNGKIHLTQALMSVDIPARPMFDWTQIERWKGDISHLPPDSIILNRPPSMWDQHRNLLIGLLAALLVLAVCVVALLINRRHRIATEKALLDSEDRCRSRLLIALEHQQQYEEGLELMLDLHRRTERMSERQVIEQALDIAVSKTQSSVGYLHVVDEDLNQLTLFAWNGLARQECAVHCQLSYPLDSAGVWVDCVKTRQPVIHNNFQELPGKRTLPADHLHVVRHMNAPVVDGDKVRMIIGVGNKAADYDGDDSRLLQMIANEVQKCVLWRRAEQALAESEARFRFITDLSPGLVWVADPDMRCTWVNQTRLDFTGKSMEQELGSGWQDRIHPDDIEAARAISSAHFATRQPFTNEFRMLRHDGQYRWVLNTARPQFDERGEFKGFVGSALDITERKQAEVDRELFHTIFTLSLDLMCVTGADGYFKKVNPSFSRVLGYSEQELLARPAADFVLPVDRAKTLDQKTVMLNGATMLDFTNRIRCKDGTVRELSWRAFHDPIAGLTYANARDVTTQRTNEEQLNKLWLAVEQISHSIVITDLAGRIEYVNRAFSTVSGYSAAEVAGQNPRMLQSGLTPASTYAQMWATLMKGETWDGEFQNKRKNGDIYAESVRISPVRQPNGKITHYLAVKEDITDFKCAMKEIEESKTLLQRVIDSTPDWIHVKDKQHRFMLVNRSFAAALGQTPERMIGHFDTDFNLLNMLVNDPAQGMRNMHNDDLLVFNGQTIHSPDDRFVFENGETHIFDTFKGPLRDAAQGIYGVLCYRRDITERFNTEQEQKVLEAQLRQAQKMELIGHLTGGIAHDFNNILASIFGYAELVQMSQVIQASPQLKQYLQEILQAGTRAKELVAQLLNFSVRKDMTSEAIRVPPIINEVARLLRATMPSSISIKTDLAPDLPPVLLSQVQLHQILMNLGINARDAITARGTIEFRAEPCIMDGASVCASCHQQFTGNYLMIVVRDSGAGIVPADMLKIFDPFFTTKEIGRGSGLGLSVLHGIVHSANGHIDVLSAANQGTEFRIYLPAQEAVSSLSGGDGKIEAERAPLCGTVMVIDDEASIVGFMTAFLESLGCRVIGLTSSSEALRRFQKDPGAIDMVITDQTMPEMTGAELARIMLACRPELPIVMSTGFSSTIDEDAACQIGIRRFMVKPVPARVLADIVTECLTVRQ